MRRPTKLLALALALGGVGLAVAFAPQLRDSQALRRQVEGVLSDAVHRDVTVSEVVLDSRKGAVELRGIEVANPVGFESRTLMTADALRFDLSAEQLLGRQVVGDLRVTGLDVHVIKLDGLTNLHGLLTDSAAPESNVDLHVDLDVESPSIKFEDLDGGETVTLDEVRVLGRLSNRGGARQARLRLTAETLTVSSVRVFDVNADVTLAPGGVTVHELSLALRDRGQLRGHGTIDLPALDWDFELGATELGLASEVLPIVAALHPSSARWLALPEAQLEGKAQLQFDARGRGTSWETVRDSLTADGTLALHGLRLPANSTAAHVLALRGSQAATVPLPDAHGAFAIDAGRLSVTELRIGDRDVAQLLLRDQPLLGLVARRFGVDAIDIEVAKPVEP